MTKLNPFIRFNNGKCKEAMNFYNEVLEGELNLMTVAGTPMEKDMPEDKRDLIMHSTLTSKRGTLIGSDMMRDTATIGDNVGVSLECESEEDINKIFDHLSKGGEIFMKPEPTFWGAIFGLVTDKYGVEWMLNFQKTPMK